MNSQRAPIASSILAFLWAGVAALLEAALRRQATIHRGFGVLPMVLGGGLVFMLGRIIGLALRGAF